ncbi:transposase [Clostridia bacterium]|nr:transposase [Clostridia bacterium]
MNMSYDIKYRRRALEYWGEGNSKGKTAEVFRVNPSTLQRWKSRLKETGKVEAKKRSQTWRKIEPSRLLEVMEEHPDAYLKEIVKEFGCSGVAISKALRRLKITRKKNDSIQGN